MEWRTIGQIYEPSGGNYLGELLAFGINSPKHRHLFYRSTQLGKPLIGAVDGTLRMFISGGSWKHEYLGTTRDFEKIAVERAPDSPFPSTNKCQGTCIGHRLPPRIRMLR